MASRIDLIRAIAFRKKRGMSGVPHLGNGSDSFPCQHCGLPLTPMQLGGHFKYYHPELWDQKKTQQINGPAHKSGIRRGERHQK